MTQMAIPTWSELMNAIGVLLLMLFCFVTGYILGQRDEAKRK